MSRGGFSICELNTSLSSDSLSCASASRISTISAMADSTGLPHQGRVVPEVSQGIQTSHLPRPLPSVFWSKDQSRTEPLTFQNGLMVKTF
ncbi:hypothetical protein Syun_023919 [Stephania yunnanensis]|uniref:Uncharacterized protein n=1 Tax=Stephania yunnanensis TaxID=152371 RepID=A0AAP0I020_9MAGN